MLFFSVPECQKFVYTCKLEKKMADARLEGLDQLFWKGQLPTDEQIAAIKAKGLGLSPKDVPKLADDTKKRIKAFRDAPDQEAWIAAQPAELQGLLREIAPKPKGVIAAPVGKPPISIKLAQPQVPKPAGGDPMPDEPTAAAEKAKAEAVIAKAKADQAVAEAKKAEEERLAEAARYEREQRQRAEDDLAARREKIRRDRLKNGVALADDSLVVPRERKPVVVEPPPPVTNGWKQAFFVLLALLVLVLAFKAGGSCAENRTIPPTANPPAQNTTPAAPSEAPHGPTRKPVPGGRH